MCSKKTMDGLSSRPSSTKFLSQNLLISANDGNFNIFI